MAEVLSSTRARVGAAMVATFAMLMAFASSAHATEHSSGTDYSDVTTAVTSEITTALPVALVITGLVIGVIVSVKLIKRFAS